MKAIKYDDPILGQLDELLGGGIFRTEKRTIGPEIEKAITEGNASGVQKILSDLGDLKSISTESIVLTPALSLAAFGLLAADKINARLARSIDTPRDAGPMSLSYADILLIAANYRGAAATATSVVGGKLALSPTADELIKFVCDAVETHQVTAIRNAALAGDSALDRMLTEWRTGETMLQRILREQAEDEAKAKAAADRRRQRQYAAGFDAADIDAGLAEDIK